MALAILLLRAAAAVPWEDLDLGRPEKIHGGPHLRNGGGAGLASCEAPAEPETVLRHAWAKVVDEMLTSEEADAGSIPGQLKGSPKHMSSSQSAPGKQFGIVPS